MSIFDKLFKSKAPVVPASDTASGIVRTPDHGDFNTLFARATAESSARNFERAIQLYDEAIKANPTSAEAFYKRANALKDLGRLEEALASYDAAVDRKPDYAYAYCNRGFVQQRLGLIDDALSSYDEAIALEPTDALAHYNRARVLQDCFRWEEALAGYDNAIAANPEFPDAQFNRGLALLLHGNFDAGWRGFEWRWKNAERLNIGAVRDFREPLWLGEESIAGTRLLLHSEQGLGDTLQFSRYATLCAKAGATVILEIQPQLLGLLGSLEGVAQLVARGSPLPRFDLHCPLMSLPLAFKTRLETIPAAPQYLRADADRVAHWRTILGQQSAPRVGLVWSGNRFNWIDTTRSIRLADWLAGLPPGLQYFRLQRDISEEDQATLDGSSVIFSYDEQIDFSNFDDTAALCECMDLVISVDTSIAHLGGALGRRTWVVLPANPDWRWLRNRSDSPWYPGVRLYRQDTQGDWNGVLGRVATDLRREFGGG